MPKENAILAIDVGSDNLKMAEFFFPPTGGIELRKFAFRRYNEAEDEFGDSFRELLMDMTAEKHFTATRVRLSLSGQSSFSRLSKLPPLIGNASAVNRVVEYEARQTVPFPMNEVVWDYQLIRHAWEDHRIEEQEDGTSLEISSAHEEYEALFVAAKLEIVTRYTNILEDAGKSILSVEIAPVALFNAAKASGQCGNDECVLLLNIGGHSTNLMIADSNRVFMRNIPIAGDAITQQVAKEYAITQPEAEELKHRHGFVALGGAFEEPESVVAATISKLARNVMTRLHGEVSRSINVWRAQHGGNAPTRVLLSGGGSTMMYITDFFQEKLRMSVDYLNTFGTIQIGADVDREELQSVAPMTQELIGMSLRSLTVCPVDISLVPPAICKQEALDRRKPYFYLSSATLLSCLLLLFFGVKINAARESKLVGSAQEIVEKTQSVAQDIQQLKSSIDGEKKKYDDVMALLKMRSLWSDRMMELQRMMPDLMWLTSVDVIGEEAPQVQPTEDPQMMPQDNGDPFNRPAVTRPAAQEGPAEEVPGEKISQINKVIGLKLTGYTLIQDRDLLENVLLKNIIGTVAPAAEGDKKDPAADASAENAPAAPGAAPAEKKDAAPADPAKENAAAGNAEKGDASKNGVAFSNGSAYFEIPNSNDNKWGLVEFKTFDNNLKLNLTRFEIRIKFKEPVNK